MPENLSTLLRSTEPTVLTTGWGRTEGPALACGGLCHLCRPRRQSAPALGSDRPGERGPGADGGGERVHPRSPGAAPYV